MKAIEAAREAFKGQWKDNVLLFDNAALDRDLKAAITAFLEAAAEDENLCESVGAKACPVYEFAVFQELAGKAAILALKETLG